MNSTETVPGMMSTITATSTLSQPADTVTITASQSNSSTSTNQASQGSLSSPSNTTLFIAAAVGGFILTAVSAVFVYRHRAVGEYGREVGGKGETA